MDTLLGRFAARSGCAEPADASLWPAWDYKPIISTDPTQENRAVEAAAAANLYCVAATECRGDINIARCSWEGGHEWYASGSSCIDEAGSI